MIIVVFWVNIKSLFNRYCVQLLTFILILALHPDWPHSISSSIRVSFFNCRICSMNDEQLLTDFSCDELVYRADCFSFFEPKELRDLNNPFLCFRFCNHWLANFHARSMSITHSKHLQTIALYDTMNFQGSRNLFINKK